ncbi:hypothetical protein QF031_001160 [Pseudarthrobacter defluvii]|uniref:hypothetical protein n=1 Tax=Pseudarthrobacter defluvii TaxID=410837 RepID=UPI00278A3463|nr:hypothetical protein [Pseudarthrobacter defluvii]MDQ0768411.1 hypothetical protein [Pseudarthrobacter defluvii]
MTNPSQWSEPDGFAYAAPAASNKLPGWAKTYRTVLIVLGFVAMAWLLIIAAGYALSPREAAGRTSASILLLIVDVLFALAAVPYLIASAVYGTLWALSLRGGGYAAGGFSSFFLVASPATVTVAVGIGAARVIMPWSV